MALKEPGAVRAPFRPLEKRLWLVHWLRPVRPRHLVARRSGSRKATRNRNRRKIPLCRGTAPPMQPAPSVGQRQLDSASGTAMALWASASARTAASRQPAAAAAGLKRHFWRHFYIKIIVLPRQARDKHREDSKKMAFWQRGRWLRAAHGPCVRGRCRGSCDHTGARQLHWLCVCAIV
eukprot:COSAG06_NODE_259_length_18912_cov_53.912614_2_plen_178_part_00